MICSSEQRFVAPSSHRTADPPTCRTYIFATDLREAARIVIGQRAARLAGPPGNVVIRVAPGGEAYWVAVTSNGDESDRVVAVKGPFR